MFELAPPERERLERAGATSIEDAPVTVDPVMADRVGGAGVAAAAADGEVFLRSRADLPGTLRGDLLFAHEMAHVAQQRAVGPTAPEQRLEHEADSFAARFADPSPRRPARLSAAGPLTLQRCTAARTPSDLATLDAEAKAGVVRRLIEDGEFAMEDAVLEVFSAARESGEFVALQDSLDMSATFEGLDDWTVVRIGALGPVVDGVDLLTQRRGEIIRDTTHDIGLANAQVYALFIIDSTQDDQVRDLLAWLAADNRYAQTIGAMPAVKERLTARGIDPAEYVDREEGLGDLARGLGGAIGDFLTSGQAFQESTASKYSFRALDLPEPHQEALREIQKATFEQMLSPGNVALGAFDALTFGIPLGAYSLIAGLGSGVMNLAEGELDAGARDLFPALLAVGVAVGIKVLPKAGAASGGAPKSGGGAPKAGGGSGGGGRVRFASPAAGGVLTIDDLLGNLAAETRAGFVALRKMFPDPDIVRGAEYLRRDTQAAAFVERHKQPGFKALLDNNGNVVLAATVVGSIVAPAPAPAPAPAVTTGPTVPETPEEKEPEEDKPPSPPFQWVDPLNYATVTDTGGLAGALDFTWGRDASGATSYSFSIDVNGATYTANARTGLGWHGHHNWPEFLGGPRDQTLMTVRHALHISILHPALLVYMRAQGHNITTHTTDPRNQAFIANLQDPLDRTLRQQVYDELTDFYELVNLQTSPQMPVDAYRLGLDDSLVDLGG